MALGCHLALAKFFEGLWASVDSDVVLVNVRKFVSIVFGPLDSVENGFGGGVVLGVVAVEGGVLGDAESLVGLDLLSSWRDFSVG